MKKVYNSSSEVIHLFAQQTQPEARCSNVFFYDKKIYSYGHHYLLGEFITNDKNEPAIIINDDGYSVTTAKHVRQIIHATSQYRQFFTQETRPSTVLHRLEQYASKLQTARKKELYLQPALRLYAKYKAFQQWKNTNTDAQTDVKIEAIYSVFNGKDYTEYLNEKQAVIKKAEAKAKAEATKRFKKDLKRFFAYEIDSVYSNNSGEDFCRISEDKASIETTQRVRVPIKEAKILYSLIKAGKDIKGFKISDYTVIGINGVLTIGCHKINRKNVTEIGEQILSL